MTLYSFRQTLEVLLAALKESTYILLRQCDDCVDKLAIKGIYTEQIWRSQVWPSLSETAFISVDGHDVQMNLFTHHC